MLKSAYTKAPMNAAIYTGAEKSMADFMRSTRHFFTADYIQPGMTFLDIGGAAGDLCNAICLDVAPIEPTIIEPDRECVAAGRSNHPNFTFVEGYFPDALTGATKFDVVSMQALFPQLPNWKEMLLAMRARARKFINISLTFRLDGTTVIDKDVSYFYYLDSGERVHQVIHNIYEFVNFLCIQEMNVKKIEFYGYHTTSAGHNFRCVPNAAQIRGNLMIEMFDPESDNPSRMGGAVEKGKSNPDYRFFLPEMNIVIDDKRFDVR